MEPVIIYTGYLIDLGAELLELVGAIAEVVGDVAEDEHPHRRRRQGLAHGAHQAQGHECHVRRVRVREH